MPLACVECLKDEDRGGQEGRPLEAAARLLLPPLSFSSSLLLLSAASEPSVGGVCGGMGVSGCRALLLEAGLEVEGGLLFAFLLWRARRAAS